MKAKALFSGYDSLGVPVEVAESVSGVWFYRIYEFNGYAKAWSKWAVKAKAPTFPEKLRNNSEFAGAPEFFDVTPGSVIEWGFTVLRAVSGPLRIRLPS